MEEKRMKERGKRGICGKSLKAILGGAALGCLLLLTACGGGKTEVPGVGTVQTRETLDSGVEYGVTEQNYAVVLQVPEDVEVLDLTELEQERAGVYVIASALEEADGLRSVTLGEHAAFDKQLLERFLALPEFTYPEDCMTGDWIVAVEQAAEVNALRRENGLPEVEPDLQLTRICRIRVDELAEQWDLSKRPNGEAPGTLLEEGNVSYTFQTNYSAKTLTLEQMDSPEYLPAIAEIYGGPADVNYERVGYSIGREEMGGQPYYILFTFAVSSAEEGTTVNGYSYQLVTDDDEPFLRITGYDGEGQNGVVPGSVGGLTVREVDDDLFRNKASLLGVGFPNSIRQIPEHIFDGSEHLRVIQVGPDTELPAGLTEQYLVFETGQELGEGVLYWTWAYEDAIYGQTQEKTMVLLDISPGVTQFEIPEQLGDYPVTYIHDDALSRAADVTDLSLPLQCGFSRDFYEQAIARDVALRAPSDSVAKSLFYGYQVADAINRVREENGLPEILVSVPLTRLAWTRAQELEETFGTTRPNGKSGISILNEAAFPYDIGYEKVGAADTIEDIQESFYEQWTQDCALTRTYQETSYLLEQIGVGVHLGQRDGEERAFVDWLAVRLEEE